VASGWLAPRFTRVVSSGRFIPEIDGLRFIAIGTVVLFHLAINLSIRAPETYALPESGSWLATVARYGFHGVELFFVISGFILALPFAAARLRARPPVRLGQYFLRRVTRLEPPYIICMIVFFLALVVIKGQSAAVMWPHLLASLGYVHNLVYGEASLINNVAWSLEIEIQFYLLVPLLATVFAIRRPFRRRAVIVGLSLLSIAGHVLIFGEHAWLSLTILNFLHFFLIGFLLADIYLVEWNEAPVRHIGWDLASLLGWPALFWVWSYSAFESRASASGGDTLASGVFFPMCAFFLYCAVFRGSLTNRIMTTPWITTIGGMCYSIYLLHNYAIGFLIGLTKGIAPAGYELNLLIQGVLVIPLVLATCALYFGLIERPCMRRDWPARAWRRLSRTLFVPVSEYPAGT
jgi:peptidoglycan/LPS O-acetylase OafA/YrhL